jgi:hypothetical protein
MAKRLKVGDVIEIETRRGLAYAQYTHRVEGMGYLIRVVEDTFRVRPSCLAAVVRGRTAFKAVFPLQRAVNLKMYELVGNHEVPEEDLAFPVFRQRGFVDREGRVHDWYLWDGERTWKLQGGLTAETRKYPLREIINAVLLVERIENRWTHEAES